MLTQILNDLGFTNITTFSSGAECFQNLHLNPELIFLDYQMEGMDGLTVLQKIKAYNSKISVVFCTAHEDLGVAIDALQYGSLDYLLKGNANRQEVASIISA